MGKHGLVPFGLFVAGVLCTTCLSGCLGRQDTAGQIVLGASQNGETVYLQRGDSLSIALNDPSSGCSWKLSGHNAKLLDFQGKQGSGESGLADRNSGQLLVYRFRARDEGATSVRFELLAGDEEYAPIDELEFDVIVEGRTRHLASAR